MLRTVAGGVEIDVRVIPRARRTEIAGVRDNALLIRLAAPPVDNAANEALVDFLSSTLGISRSAIRVLAGATSRRKRLLVSGVNAERLRQLIGTVA
jgi:hypothetical protein